MSSQPGGRRDKGMNKQATLFQCGEIMGQEDLPPPPCLEGEGVGQHPGRIPVQAPPHTIATAVTITPLDHCKRLPIDLLVQGSFPAPAHTSLCLTLCHCLFMDPFPQISSETGPVCRGNSSLRARTQISSLQCQYLVLQLEGGLWKTSREAHREKAGCLPLRGLSSPPRDLLHELEGKCPRHRFFFFP